MASRKAAPAKADWRTLFRKSIARSLVIAAAVALGLFKLSLTLVFLIHDGTDAATTTAAGGKSANWLGCSGAWLADLSLLVAVVPVVMMLPTFVLMRWRSWVARPRNIG